MSKFDYDVVFYRVFCITLLVTAFTFAVIITNVFVDIDGLLSSKEKYAPEISEFTNKLVSNIHEETPFEVTKIQVSNEDVNYDSEISPSFRTKRSIETENGIHIKNPEMKKILTNKLANLLEELDKETKKEFLETTTVKEFKRVFEGTKESTSSIRNKDLLHLAMHNILLQGLLGHMDLNDVYKKVHILVENFNKNMKNEAENDKKIKTLKYIINSNEISKEPQYNEEHKFFEEIVQCKKLEDQIAQLKKSKEMKNTTKRKEDKKVYIKAIIEINDKNDTFAVDNGTKLKENIEGIVNLIYNGKSIKINQLEHQAQLIKTNVNNTGIVNQMLNNNKILIRENSQLKQVGVEEKDDNATSRNPLFDQVIEEYLKKHAFPNYSNMHDGQKIESINNHRLKRQIKIRYFDDVTTSKTKLFDKTDDDDLYIEIETHFDGKGIKGEKKKKLVRNLIDKIQKALHSDIQEKRDNVEHIKFVKRSQDPIIHKKKATYLNTISPLPVEPRQLDPIDKTLKNHENIAHAQGETWKKQVYGPNFLSASKSVNSAEMRELNIDYDRVLKNGMSKRLQKPLNTDTEEIGINSRLLEENKGNVTLFLKNIEGTGFSIGFNQYVGEPPDSESMKMFTGVENLIREYHKSYDQEQLSNESDTDKLKKYVDLDHGVAKRNVEDIHKMVRRSVKQAGTENHRNEYKIFIQRSIPLKKYLNLNNHSNYKFNDNQTNTIRTKKFTVEENLKLFDQSRINNKPIKLIKPLTSLKRSRRSLSINKMSSLKSKIKLNRYLNTKAMANKKIFIKNKRSKRQVDTIRIIARDKSQTLRLSGSDENIFLISKENSYTDKVPIISEVSTPDKIIDNKSNVRDDEDSPFNNIYQIQNSHLQPINYDEFHNNHIRSNALMSKYPHILVNERTWSKEEEYVKDEKQYRINVKPYRIQSTPEQDDVLRDEEMSTEFSKSVSRDLDPKVKEIVNAIIPRLSKTNYKVTLKISPKNKTNIDAGFKEVHTTVNKSFEENGLRFFSLINLSQISKVEMLNRTDLEVKNNFDDHLKKQKNHLSDLLRLHKNKIDIQLNTLLEESKHLQKIIESNNDKMKFKNTTSSDFDKPGFKYTERPPDDLASAKNLRDICENSTNCPGQEESTIKSTTQFERTTKLPSIYTDKINLLNSIKHNEKITIEILNKIDSNTNILKTFLRKFSEKFEKNQAINIPTIDKTTKKSPIEVKLDLTKDWKVFDPKHNPFMISNELRNDTIPFIYAYQQNIPTKNKKIPQGLASVVYHGHIHTEENGKNNKFIKTGGLVSNSKINADKEKLKFNETKFFMDDINHFKIIQKNTPMITANIKINTTAT